MSFDGIHSEAAGNGWAALVSCLLRVTVFLNSATVSRIATRSTQLLVSWGCF